MKTLKQSTLQAIMIVFGLLFLCRIAAADVVLSVGVGKGILYHNGTPFERFMSVGYEHEFPIGVFIRPEVGYFLDVSGKTLSSFWAAPLLGVRARSPIGPLLHFAVGPGYLQNPDSILGGHFQFSLEGGVALEDKNFALGLMWKHLSSAGINMPNLGRDAIVLHVRIRWPKPEPEE